MRRGKMEVATFYFSIILVIAIFAYAIFQDQTIDL